MKVTVMGVTPEMADLRVLTEQGAEVVVAPFVGCKLSLPATLTDRDTVEQAAQKISDAYLGKSFEMGSYRVHTGPHGPCLLPDTFDPLED